jgi:hypothetical protein
MKIAGSLELCLDCNLSTIDKPIRMSVLNDASFSENRNINYSAKSTKIPHLLVNHKELCHAAQQQNRY